jgi:hypothetical protein
MMARRSGALLLALLGLALAAGAAADAPPLVNRGRLVLRDGPPVIDRAIENRGAVEVERVTRRFLRRVTNLGLFKTTDAVVRFEAPFENDGAYVSDPSDNYFTDLIVGPTGYLVGGAGDRFFVSGDFISSSTQDTLWTTQEAYLEFRTGFDTLHAFHVTGADLGGVEAGYVDNFAWQTLHVAAGNSLELFDGNATPGGALYAREVTGSALSGSNVTNVSGAAGINVYYDPNALANAYLAAQTYDFGGSGQLIPLGAGGGGYTPTVPSLGTGALGLLGFGLAALGRHALCARGG